MALNRNEVGLQFTISVDLGNSVRQLQSFQDQIRATAKRIQVDMAAAADTIRKGEPWQRADGGCYGAPRGPWCGSDQVGRRSRQDAGAIGGTDRLDRRGESGHCPVAGTRRRHARPDVQIRPGIVCAAQVPGYHRGRLDSSLDGRARPLECGLLAGRSKSIHSQHPADLFTGLRAGRYQGSAWTGTDLRAALRTGVWYEGCGEAAPAQGRWQADG